MATAKIGKNSERVILLKNSLLVEWKKRLGKENSIPYATLYK
ncbi:hypothetical protein SAMN02746066_03321 [Anaerosporobacter mobilis DSM 15930]|jgi:hypothetical protein|uniref:Uncharacterized protein n=1 Tax=Anaerosporobacter mobilis DSM 15930 TaxID=1120996 RepID=A0A1M7LMU2_9FIRM|nr:hypothetical protein [Anaerosporobacter mobilis]SHM79555.1 hypothetical protein SAMN02746066_03321 [Anaerosporobacter mobilis DSM 15930]